TSLTRSLAKCSTPPTPTPPPSPPDALPICNTTTASRTSSNEAGLGGALVSIFNSVAPADVSADAAIGTNSGITNSCNGAVNRSRSEEHTSELQSRENLVCRLLLEKNRGRLA